MPLHIMAGNAPSQQVLPPTSQPRSFPFVPSTVHKEPVQRNYVFVDEHNRHKRLKVMRACEGCRRRKIRCDSATTNTWPCAACTRLKLHCVPPSVSYEAESSDTGTTTSTFELHKSSSYPELSQSSTTEFQHHTLPQQYGTIDSTMQSSLQSHTELQTYSHLTPILSREHVEHNMYPAPHSIPQSAISERSWAPTDATASNLADAFGDLQIGLAATAPYITDLKQLADTPAVQEQEIELPDLRGPDNRIRVPPEMMPSEQQSLQYFKYYFATIHPFVPVLSQPAFYQQWASNREAISPLLLEAIFAAVTAMLNKNQECAKWLALASRHEESFKDVPRLSTVQAQIILLKAKESQPSKRGYFYRSWVSLVNIIVMAKDLGIHEHLETHQIGRDCGNTPSDCVSKTRMWQWLFMMEAMIGGPQGRLNFSADEATVDFSEPKPIIGTAEFQISRQFRQLLLCLRNIRRTIRGFTLHQKKGGDWSFHRDYTSVEDEFRAWGAQVPEDLRVTLPKDDSLPWIASPFIGHTNAYYHLSFIMHHRPQIHYLMESVNGDSWRPYLLTCLTAAKNVCRILESMLQTFGTEGLRCMLRGISFTVYAILTCTMLHLAAITAPDASINNDARDYFVRSMRLLEHCSPLWPMETVSRQIDALREAFSADTSKPFDLRPGFPFGSPTPQPSEIPLSSAYSQAHIPNSRAGTIMAHSPSSPSSSIQTPPQPQWNPSHLFNKWSSAFYTTAQRDPVGEQYSPNLPSIPAVSVQGSSDPTRDSAYDSPLYPSHGYPQEANHLGLGQAPMPAPSQLNYGIEYVSPAAWQDAVASSFATGMKRRWKE